LVLFVVILIGTGTAVETSASHVEQPNWAFRWTVQADGSSELLRRPAKDVEADWKPAGSIPEPMLEVVTTPYDPLKVLASTDAAVHWYQISDCQVLERWFVSVNPSDRTIAIEACESLSDGGKLRSAERATASGVSAKLPKGK